MCGADTVAANESRVSARTPVSALHIEPVQLGVISAYRISTVSAQPLARNHLNGALNRQLAAVAAHLCVVATAAFAEAAAGSASTQTRQLHGLKALEPERRHDDTVQRGAIMARQAAPEAPRAQHVAEAVEKVRVLAHVCPAEPRSDAIHDAVRMMKPVERRLNLAQLVVVCAGVRNFLLKVRLHVRPDGAEPFKPLRLEQRLLELELPRKRRVDEDVNLVAKHSLLLWLEWVYHEQRRLPRLQFFQKVPV